MRPQNFPRVFHACTEMNGLCILFVMFFVAGAIASSRDTRSCNSCGRECENACGTRNFRTCCFNYMRKRSVRDPLSLVLDPSLRLELWLAKSRTPYFESQPDDKENPQY